MQTSLAALYKGSGFVLGQMREGKGRGEGSREGEGSSRAGKRKRVEKKKCVCAWRSSVAAEAQVSVAEHSITSSSKGLY